MKTRLLNGVRYKKLNLGGYGYTPPSMSDTGYVKKDRQQLGDAKNAMDTSAGVVTAINPIVGGAVKLGSEGFQANQRNTTDSDGYVKKDAGFARSFGYLTANPVAAYAKAFDRLGDSDLDAGEKAAGFLLPGIATAKIDYDKSERAKKEQADKITQYYKDSFSNYSKSKISSGEVNLQGNSGARMFKLGGKAEELMNVKKEGGSFKKLSKDTVEVDGKTHEEGGVKIPSKGVEVEDGETIKGNFVFSDKLGFADKHKKLAKEIGKVEKSPDSNRKFGTLQRLKDQEKQLMVAQESLKEKLGIDNDKDDVMSKGGIFMKGKKMRGTEGLRDDSSLKTAEDPEFVDAGTDVKTRTKFNFRNAGRNAAEIAPSLIDSISGFTNATRRLNTPVEQIGQIPKLKFSKVSADASLNEADRQRLAANKFAQQNLSDSNVVAAANASNLASTIAAKNEIYQNVNNKNADIKNAEMQANQEITEKNISNSFANQARKRLATDEAYQDMHDATLAGTKGFAVFNKDKKAERIGTNQSLIDAASKMTPEEFASFKSNMYKYGYEKKYGGKLDKMGDGGNIKTIYHGKDKIESNHKDIAEMKGNYPIYKKGSELHKEYVEGMEKAKKEGANYAMIHGYNYLINEPTPKSKNSFASIKDNVKSIESEDLKSLPEKDIRLFDKTRPNKDTSKSIVEKPKERAHNSRTYSSGEGYYFIDKDNGRKVSSKSRIGIGIKRLFS